MKGLKYLKGHKSLNLSYTFYVIQIKTQESVYVYGFWWGRGKEFKKVF